MILARVDDLECWAVHGAVVWFELAGEGLGESSRVLVRVWLSRVEANHWFE